MIGEMDALIGSFAGEPELHHPVRGRIKGARAFERYVNQTKAWLEERRGTVEDVNVIDTPRGGVEEVLVRLDSGGRGVELPVAVAGEHDENHRFAEMRVYYSTAPLIGSHATRAPVLQLDPDLQVPDVVGEYQRALASGDIEAAVAAFEPDGYMREPAGPAHTHRGTDALRALYASFFSRGGIALEHCALTDDERVCALEYNVLRWGEIELPPQAGIAVYVRGGSGKLAAARIYDDADPPLG
jgi:hypothetical protein